MAKNYKPHYHEPHDFHHDPHDFHHDDFCLHGENPLEYCHRLNGKLCRLEKMFDDVLGKADCTLEQMKKSVKYNGAYYDGCVKVEEGFHTGENTAYKIIRVPRCDKSKSPIEFKLHLAYGNSTNSKINESVFSASEFEMADKIFTANIGNVNTGWQGLCTLDFAPIPSDENLSGYSVGFTEHGHLIWYRNTTSRQQLCRDKIKNSMGVTGILVNAHAVTDESMWGVDDNDKTARICMGQDYNSGDVYILVVGDNDKVNESSSGSEYGMTVGTAAKIMSAYCDIAVNVAYGGGDYGCAALDKGTMLFSPSNNVVQSNYAFWYISRKKNFLNQYTTDIALLTQKYAQLQYFSGLKIEGIEDLSRRIEEAERKIIELESASNQHTTLLNEHEKRITNNESELRKLKAEFTDIDTDFDIINKQWQSIQTEFSSLESKVDEALAEFKSIKTQFTDLNNNVINLHTELDAEIARATGAEQGVRDELHIESDARDRKDTELENLIKAIDLTSINANIQDITQRLTTVESDVENVESSIEEATTNAQTALEKATSAESKADNAKTTAETASATAIQAKNTAETAQSEAQTATTTAESALEKATSAESKADSAKLTAETASTNATQAKDIAESAQTATATAESALEKATSAESKASLSNTNAETAKAWASQAQQTADTAKDTAIDAATKAAQANNTLESLQSTVQSVQSEVQTASTNATQAKSIAESAQSEANTANNKATANANKIQKTKIQCIELHGMNRQTSIDLGNFTLQVVKEGIQGRGVYASFKKNPTKLEVMNIRVDDSNCIMEDNIIPLTELNQFSRIISGSFGTKGVVIGAIMIRAVESYPANCVVNFRYIYNENNDILILTYVEE